MIQNTVFVSLTYQHHEAQSILEANSSSTSQEIPCILWNPNVHYRIHKCPLPVPILRQINQFHASPFLFLKIRCTILVSSTPRSSERSLSLRSPHQNHVSCVTCRAYLIFLNLIARVIFGEQYR